MCDQNNNCDYQGVMLVASGPKDVYFYCSHNDTEYRIPYRLNVQVCPECNEPDWRTLG
jgi:NMD protein affecting ribosome stability and mRNA decay